MTYCTLIDEGGRKGSDGQKEIQRNNKHNNMSSFLFFKTIGLLEGEISGSGEVTSDKVGLP